MSPASSTDKKPTDKKKSRSAAAASAKREKARPAGKGSEPRAAETGQGGKQADKQDGKNGTKRPLGARIRARTGASGARSVLLAVRAGLVFGVALLSYLLAMFVAVTAVPSVFLVVSSGTNVGPNSPFELQITYWLAPSLFLIGLLFALVLVAVRWLWRAQRRAGERARRALLGGEAGR